MTRLLISLLCLLPVLCGAQGFGSFSHDQPYLARDLVLSSTKDIPDMQTNQYFRWVALDYPTNTYVTGWTDRVQQAVFSMVDTNQQPYNSALGMEFDGHPNALTNYPGIVVETNNTVLFWVWVREQVNMQQNKGNSYYVASSIQNGGYGLYIDVDGSTTAPETLSHLRRASTNRITDILVDHPRPLGVYEDVILQDTAAGTTVWTNGVMYAATNQLQNDPWTLGGFGGSLDKTPSTNNARFILSEFILYTNRSVNLADVSNFHYYATHTYTNDPYSPAGTTNWVGLYPVFRNSFRNDGTTPCTDGDALQFLYSEKMTYWGLFAGNGANTGGRYILNGGPNGYPAVDTSTNIFGYYDCVSGHQFSWANPFTVYFIAKVTDSSTDNALMGSAAGGACDLVISSGAGGLMTGGANLTLPAFASTGWTLFVASWNGANSFVRTNGQWFAYGNTGTTSLQLFVAMQNGATNKKWKGRVTELGIGHFAISTNEVSQLEKWANRKYALW